MYYFVVAERQHEILVEEVHHAERKLVLVVGSEEGIDLEIVQSVMHPTHHPLHPKAESTGKSGSRYTWPICCFLCNGLYIGKVAENGLVQIFNEGNRFQVTISPILVGFPLAVAAGIVELEYGRYGIYTYPVHVKEIQPEARAAYEEGFYLSPLVIEDIAVPVRMKAFAHVGIL